MSPAPHKALAGLLLCTACGGPSTVQDLAKEVVSHLASNDFVGLSSDLVASQQEVLEVCPTKSAYDIDVQKYRDGFDACAAKLSWKQAVLQPALPQMGFAPDCGAQIEYATNIAVKVTAGSTATELTLNSAIKTGNGWKLTAPFSCK